MARATAKSPATAAAMATVKQLVARCADHLRQDAKIPNAGWMNTWTSPLVSSLGTDTNEKKMGSRTGKL
eukprot:5658162-Pleurochrysis_carterae.AAC.1